MHTARRLTLLAFMGLAAVALAAPAAFAQESPLESTHESTGVHCAAVTVVNHEPTGGCPVHATSEGGITLRQHVFGVESTMSTCDEEISGVSDENTEGYGFAAVISGPSCPREACEEAGGSQKPWPAHGHENPSGLFAGSGFFEGAVVSICLSSTSDMTDLPLCHFEIPWTSESGEPGGSQSGTLHHYEGGVPGVEMPGIGTAGFRCEALGHWMTEEPGTDLEITHVSE